MYDIVFMGMEYWDEVWRRSQNLVVHLARRCPHNKILFVSLPNDISFGLRTGKWKELTGLWQPALTRPEADLPNVYVFRPIKVFPNALAPGRLSNQAIWRMQIRKVARSLGMQDRLLWIKPHWGAHLAGRMGERAVVYDVGDDWTAVAMSESARRRAIREDDYLTRRADAVIVVSERLREKKRALAPDVHLIPNGVDFERYQSISERTLPAHPLAEGWSRPVLGYTGMLSPDRLDIDLVIEAARSFPTATLPLVGPSFLNRAQTQRLEAEPNIRLTGPVSFWELPRLMSAFDACIVPNLINAFSESQNPLKMFEYLASGLPIISTPVSGFRDYPELVYLAADALGFVAGICQALAEPDDLPARRRAAVKEQTWSARADAVIEVLASLHKGTADGR